ncbi:hypothetical protein EDB19DRAFT_1846049 [Suillus lakei]|nr:hypothetical protein EDB19DRAFT_1846049 [Suillus lakei]
MPQNPPIEIHPVKFSLNVSGVAGFFGGDEAISAIQTIHHYKARKFMGWYNTPGSWNVGKKFGILANSRFWDGLFPGPNEEPAKLFQLDGKQGPKYVASRSGSILEHTGHLAYLMMQTCNEEIGMQIRKGRVSKRNEVTLIKTQPVFGIATESAAREEPPVREIPPRSGRHTLVAILPIAVSFITCSLCGLTHDWFCFFMILLGIVSNGMSSLILGSACLRLQGVKPPPTAPPGDGMLMDGDNIVLLLGKEEDIATITRGRFILEYAPWDVMPLEPVRNEYLPIGACSLLLVIQLLAQLLLIPQGTLFGQMMFLTSFAFSWAYNLYLSSIDNEYIQEQLLLKALYLEKKHMRKYFFGTRTTAAVFACLMLQPRFKPESIICNFIPNETQVWATWREKVLEVMRTRIHNPETCHSLLQISDEEEREFEQDDKILLAQLLGDARIAYDLANMEQQWLEET